MTYREKLNKLFNDSEDLRRQLLQVHQSEVNKVLSHSSLKLSGKYIQANKEYFDFFILIHTPFNNIDLDAQIPE